MAEELERQQAGAEAAAPQGASTEATPGATMAPSTEAPDYKALVDEAVQRTRAEYESKGGHLSKLRSQYDRQVADLQRQLAAERQAKADRALKLMDTDPAQAAQLLAGVVQAQAQASKQTQAQAELSDWQRRVMGDLGFDLDSDEEAAELATGWGERLLADPNLTWDFQQEVAKKALERENAKKAAAEKELKELRESLPVAIQAEVTRALVAAGIVPDPGTGGTPSQRDDDWRKKPEGQLIKEGLAERAQRPIKRT